MAYSEQPSTVIAARFALIASLEEQIQDTTQEWAQVSSLEPEDRKLIATAIADWLLGCDYMGQDFMAQYRQDAS